MFARGLRKPRTTPARPTVVLVALCTAAFMASLDVFIVNVAFHEVGLDFRGESLSSLSWILNGYAILYAALLVPLGRLADRYGRKRMFLAGLALFTVASAACAASTGLWMLVGFRALQAIGAAALTPTSLGLLLTATPAERRVRAVRIWAASGASAAAAGPVIGGLLVEASWRWVFLVNVPVGLVALVVAARTVPDSRDPAVTRIPDLLGSVVLAGGIGALALGLVKGPDWGWTGAGTLLCFAVACVGLALFWWRSSSHPLPVVEPALLAVRSFAWSNAAMLLFATAFAAGLLEFILWMQQVWGYGPLAAGLAVAPGPLMVPLFAAIAQRVHLRVPAGRIAALGCLLLAIGNSVFALRANAGGSYATELLPGWLIGGAGVGLAMPTLFSTATVDLPPSRTSTGSGVVNMSRQIGTALGVSILVAILGTANPASDVTSAYRSAWWTVVGLCLLAALASLRITAGRRSATTGKAVVGELDTVTTR